MYFNKSNSFYHGIMFHHFHDNKIHPKSQGSITKDDFFKLIKFIGRKNILDADVFIEKMKQKKIKTNQVCFTFDDGIKSQIDIALPVLQDLKIKSFFYPYTSMFDNKPDNIEVFRYFRTNYFKNINEFYTFFFNQILNSDLRIFFKKNSHKISIIKKRIPFYSYSDIKFRLARDFYLDKKRYEEIMFKMIKKKKFNYQSSYKKIFFQKKDLRLLDSLGHIIGLHSHTHPTKMEKLNYSDQNHEYKKSLFLISKILNKSKNKIKTMSHPNGSYNSNTLKVLKKSGIELGFKSVMVVEKEKGMKKINNSFLEIAREDHANIIKRMNK